VTRAKGIAFQEMPCQLQPCHPGSGVTQAFCIAQKAGQGQ
jgi:hypothetical protein